MQPKLKLATEQVAKKQKERDKTPSVWNPDWKYQTAGSATDLAEKFRRIRRQMEQEKTSKPRRVK
jgi:hypothetical protein